MTGNEVLRAEQLVELGRFAEARTALAGCLTQDPGSGRVHGLMAQTLLGMGADSAALEHANQVVRLRPDDEWGHRLAAVTLDRLGHPQEAVRAAAEAVRLAPLSWQTHQTFAMVASEQKARHAQAGQAAQRAVELGPGHASTHFVTGLVAQRRGDRRSAAAAYQRVLAIEPEHGEALNNLTVVRRHRRLGRAARGYGASLRANPGSAVARANVERLVVRFVRRVYFIALAAVVVAFVVSTAQQGHVGPATIAVAAATVAVVAAYTVGVLREVPTGVRRFAVSRLRQPFLAASSSLTVVMLVLALAACLAPYGFVVVITLLPVVGFANLGLALWSRLRRAR